MVDKLHVVETHSCLNIIKIPRYPDSCTRVICRHGRHVLKNLSLEARSDDISASMGGNAFKASEAMRN